MKKIKSITIVGGGSAAWLAARRPVGSEGPSSRGVRLGSGAFPAPPGGSLWAQALPRALFQQAIAQESMTDFEFACLINRISRLLFGFIRSIFANITFRI